MDKYGGRLRLACAVMLLLMPGLLLLLLLVLLLLLLLVLLLLAVVSLGLTGLSSHAKIHVRPRARLRRCYPP